MTSNEIAICISCGWSGRVEEQDHRLKGEPTCPSCWSDEFEYTQPAPAEAVAELVQAWNGNGGEII